MINTKTTVTLRNNRKRRIRAKILSHGHTRPRIVVDKSHTAITLQIIDDTKRNVVVHVRVKGKNIDAGKACGAELAKKALKKGITNAVFDRSGYRYHGVVQAIADAIREGGVSL